MKIQKNKKVTFINHIVSVITSYSSLAKEDTSVGAIASLKSLFTSSFTTFYIRKSYDQQA